MFNDTKYDKWKARYEDLFNGLIPVIAPGDNASEEKLDAFENALEDALDNFRFSR